MNFIQQWQRGFSHNESYWIGGSTSTEAWSTISLSEYNTGDTGNIKIDIMMQWRTCNGVIKTYNKDFEGFLNKNPCCDNC